MAEPTLTDIEDLPAIRESCEGRRCSCSKCAGLCKGIPGIYDPAHIAGLLATKKTTIQALVPTLCEDYYYMGNCDEKSGEQMFLRPRMRSEEPGGVAPFFGSTTPHDRCVNLSETGCVLPRDQMPIGCLTAYVCDKKHETTPVSKSDTPVLWDNQTGRDVLSMFEAESSRQTPGISVGVPPPPPEENMLSAWEMLMSLLSKSARVSASQK